MVTKLAKPICPGTIIYFDSLLKDENDQPIILAAKFHLTNKDNKEYFVIPQDQFLHLKRTAEGTESICGVF